MTAEFKPGDRMRGWPQEVKPTVENLGPDIREYTDEKTGIVIRAKGMKTLAFIIDGEVVTPDRIAFKAIFSGLFHESS